MISKVGKPYVGPVVFVDGVHYPVKDGVADKRRQLRWKDGGYVYAAPTEPTHLAMYGKQIVELTVEDS